ncbi:hypothetical protein [Euzebya sp.]|uniref:hypothetical protein n=1 Tax=Euzebya sp. TaxID=1971409 RepID=UPI0035111556
MGAGRKAGGTAKQQGFIDSVEHAITHFYDTVLSRLTAWQPKPSPRTSVPEPPDDQDFNV